MATAKDGELLSELRQEYKSIKKELNEYDLFVDDHPFICIFTPFVLSLIAIVIAIATSLQWVGILSLVLFTAFIIMLCLVLARSNKISKINAKLDDIEYEVKLFHSKPSVSSSQETRGETSIDELGLWQDIHDNKRSSKSGWAMGVVVLLVIAAVISYNRTHEAVNTSTPGQAVSQQQDSQTSLSQLECLDDAQNAYNTAWDNADADGDGKLSYADGSHGITTSYYDAIISCYRTYKTVDSDSYIADYQTKRQQEVDSYNAYIQAVGNAAAGAGNNSSSNVSCTSNSIGSSTYTRCY